MCVLCVCMYVPVVDILILCVLLIAFYTYALLVSCHVCVCLYVRVCVAYNTIMCVYCVHTCQDLLYRPVYTNTSM